MHNAKLRDREKTIRKLTRDVVETRQGQKRMKVSYVEPI